MKRTTMWMAAAAVVWMALPARAALVTTGTYQFGTNNIATNALPLAGGTLSGQLNVPELYTGSFKLYRSALTPIDAGTSLNFASTNRYWSCTLTGAVTWTTSGLAAGKHANVMISNTQATNCAITFPAWVFIGYKPTYITAGKHGDLYLKSTGTTDGEVWAYYGEEQ